MKILLIMPYNCDLLHAVSLPLGILSIATNLKAHGYDVKIFDMSVSHTPLKKVIDSFEPDIAGVSVASVKHLEGALYISKKLSKMGIKVIWGGTFCDVADQNILLKNKNVEAVCFCEGEQTWLDIAASFENGGDLSGIKGIAYRDSSGRIITNPDRDFVDLTNLPILDFSLINVRAYSQYLYGCKNLMYVYLSKGCPAKCTFCTNQLTHRCTYRRRNLEHFMKETEILVNEYGVDGLYFGDEVCFLTKDQVYEVCDAFKASGLKFNWGFQTRIGILSEKEFQYCYDNGCRWIDFGIESGNKQQLELMKKGIPYDKIIPTFEICDRIGIISLANFIVGLPGETREQLKDTVNLAKTIKATQCTFLQFCFSPKTEMGQKLMQDKKIAIDNIKKPSDYKKIDFFRSRMENFSQIPRKELEVVQSFFLWQAIFKKDYSKDTMSFDLLFKHLQTLFRRLSFLSPKHALMCLFEFVFLGMRFFFDTHFHPSILKKYNLK